MKEEVGNIERQHITQKNSHTREPSLPCGCRLRLRCSTSPCHHTTALKVETCSGRKCEESKADEYAHICLMIDSDSEEEIEVNHFEIPDEGSDYIDELYFEYKFALKRISRLKKEIANLRQYDLSEMKRLSVC